MTNTRKRRLLLIAQRPNHGTQRWYSQYCKLRDDGLVTWQLGFASITYAGKEWLRENSNST